MYALRRKVLLAPEWSIRSMLPEERYLELTGAGRADTVEQAGREIVLAIIDDLWADYLANIAELRGGIHWTSWGGGDPLHKFLTTVQDIYDDFHDCLREEVAEALATGVVPDGRSFERGATWTYVTTDQPFGPLTERILKGFRDKLVKNVHAGSFHRRRRPV